MDPTRVKTWKAAVCNGSSRECGERMCSRCVRNSQQSSARPRPWLIIVGNGLEGAFWMLDEWSYSVEKRAIIAYNITILQFYFTQSHYEFISKSKMHFQLESRSPNPNHPLVDKLTPGTCYLLFKILETTWFYRYKNTGINIYLVRVPSDVIYAYNTKKKHNVILALDTMTLLNALATVISI